MSLRNSSQYYKHEKIERLMLLQISHDSVRPGKSNH